MDKWKDLQDSNPEPSLLDAITHANNEARAALAVEILEDALEMHEFEDHLWIQVDREQWEEFTKEQDK